VKTSTYSSQYIVHVQYYYIVYCIELNLNTDKSKAANREKFDESKKNLEL
jgi:hypothetical protein